jgi:hypothetical protein
MMITEDSFFYLPNLYTFQNGNSFYGSFRGLRFYVQVTDNELEGEKRLECGCDKVFFCRSWLGEFCLEESEVRASACFPLDEEGYQAVLSWLEEEYQSFAAEQNRNAADTGKGV